METRAIVNLLPVITAIITLTYAGAYPGQKQRSRQTIGDGCSSLSYRTCNSSQYASAASWR